MFGRRTRTLFPSTNKLLSTPRSSEAEAAFTAAKARQALYYNVGAREREPFARSQTVRAKLHPDTAEWCKAEVVKVLPHRSYALRFEDGA